MDISIVYEDELLFVIEKPPGVVVNKAESVRVETIQDWIENRHSGEPEATPESSTKTILDVARMTVNEEFKNRAGIVHRLDKDTSGLLIIAKTPQAFFNLQAQFKERTVSKKYITLVHGKVVPETGEIKASVGRLPWNRERFGILPGGREATTSYRLLKSLKSSKGEIFSLLEVTPTTGRTHQIRIHLKYLGHSVVADNFYAGRKTVRADVKFCPRLFLHAAYIKFAHPQSLKIMELESRLPDDLQKVLELFN